MSLDFYRMSFGNYSHTPFIYCEDIRDYEKCEKCKRNIPDNRKPCQYCHKRYCGSCCGHVIHGCKKRCDICKKSRRKFGINDKEICVFCRDKQIEKQKAMKFLYD